MEVLLYFALIMLKTMSPSEASDPHSSTPAAATVGTSTQTLVVEPLVAFQPAAQDVAIEPSEAELEPFVATPTKAKTFCKKKTKKKK